MFWQKKQDRVSNQISQIHSTLQRSFLNVKNDTQNIFQWINYLYQQNNQQQKKITDQQSTIVSLQKELALVPKGPQEIKRILDSYYSFDSILERIRYLSQKVDEMASVRVVAQAQPQSVKPTPAYQTISPDLHSIKERLQNLEEQRKATIREKVVQRVTKNSKEYVKSLIMSYIRKYNQISALQLKEMIVLDQGLCSKSSFYRILDEIEELSEVGTARKGKQKYYLHKILKRQ